MRKYNKAKNTAMHHKIFRVLNQFANSTVIDHVLWQRASIILAVVSRTIDQKAGMLYGVSRNVVGRWRKRFINSLPILNRIARKRSEALAANIRIRGVRPHSDYPNERWHAVSFLL